MKRTKIIATIGPTSESVSMLKELITHGMNIARLNFSHGTHDEHLQRINNIRQASAEVGIPVAIMLDTKGPEIRTGTLKENKITLTAGEIVTLTTADIIGDAKRFSINYNNLPNDVSVGSQILLDDGLIALSVIAIDGQEISCRILNTGELSNHKGVNVPNTIVKLPAVTEKDRADIAFGIAQQVDFIAASFIRSAKDVLEIRRILEEAEADIHIIAKIENAQGVENLDEILEAADGLMVARGDMGVEIPAEEVPLVQKKMIAKCNKVGKPVITATQMLDSMIRNPRPTRAEASDVANAIFDGTDAIMLSGETAAGKYPLEAVKTMNNIAQITEKALDYEHLLLQNNHMASLSTTAAIGYATCMTASNLQAAAIITATESGSTARMISRFRPSSPIIAVTSSEKTLRKLILSWGVTPLLGEKVKDTDTMIDNAITASLQSGFIERGDLVVLTAGVPVGIPGTTNLLKVEIVGQMLAKGIGIGNGSLVGFAKKVIDATEADKITEGDILVTYNTDADLVAAMQKADAIITEEAGLTSHGAIVALSLGKPIIVGATDIMAKVSDNDVLTLDFTSGIIYEGHVRLHS